MKESKRYEQYMYSYPHKSAYRYIEKQIIIDAFKNFNDKHISLYIHIPFCSSKCGYCNLFSITANSELIDEYISAICRQAKQYGDILREKNVCVKDIIFGGGTPLILNINQFEKIFKAIEYYFQIDVSKCKFDIETSPNETTKEKLDYLKKRGMRRISIGIQSFKEKELESLYRHHSKTKCHEALGYLKKVNPICLNIDLIYGIEGQTLDSFKDSIKEALNYSPDEFFIYPLYIRRNTALFNKMKVDKILQQEMYKNGVNYLKSNGYMQTSMRRLIKMATPKEATLLEKSCGFEQVISLGCGGRNYVGNIHFCEPYEIDKHRCKNIIKDYIKKENFLDGMKGYVLDKDEQMRRFIIKNLGYYRGVHISEFNEHFSENLLNTFEDIWRTFELNGFIYEDNGFMRLTDKGMANSDYILALWISDNVKKGMKE